MYTEWYSLADMAGVLDDSSNVGDIFEVNGSIGTIVSRVGTDVLIMFADEISHSHLRHQTEIQQIQYDIDCDIIKDLIAIDSASKLIVGK